MIQKIQNAQKKVAGSPGLRSMLDNMKQRTELETLRKQKMEEFHLN